MRVEFVPRDMWVGVFWRHSDAITDSGPIRAFTDVWVCLLPCFPIHATIMHRMTIQFTQPTKAGRDGGVMSDRIVQTTWTDGGPHQPLPPPDDPQGDEIERLTARIAELTEASQAVLANLDHLRDVWGDEGVTRTVCDKLRKAIETPEPRP